MICENCHYIIKEHSIDEEGNLHISWKCEKRVVNLYYQVIRSPQFLERNIGYEKIEVMIRPKINKCSKFMPKTYKLTDFFSEKPEKT